MSSKPIQHGSTEHGRIITAHYDLLTDTICASGAYTLYEGGKAYRYTFTKGDRLPTKELIK